MGQKVNPNGLRVGVIREWESRWYANKKKFGDTLVQDYQLREFIEKFKLSAADRGGRNNAPKDGAPQEAPKTDDRKSSRGGSLVPLSSAGIAAIEIERLPEKVRINIFCAKPGLVIGRNGAGIESLRAAICKKFDIGKQNLALNIFEIKSSELSAKLVAEKIAADLENRASFRRAMKGSISRTMKAGAKGIKIKCGGRLGGAEIARSECYHEGTIPLQTIRADIDYGFAEANTTYGRIGIKVWIYKGEILKGDAAKAVETKERREKGRNDRSRDGRRRRDDRAGSGDRRPRRDDRAGGERRPRRDFGERTDRPQGQNRREGGPANAAAKES